MPFNLLTDPWLPVRRRSGAADWIAPTGIAATEPDPVVALDWPRPDFRLAGAEFLIGLLAVACPPAGQAAWTAGYRQPPDAATLSAAFAPLAHAFVLDGDGPRFMQDFEDFAADANDVGTLLIETPGEATIRKNTDLMVRRGRVGVLSRAAAAMALFTLQTYAPAGGAGNRTSLRGGGPLTTLALPPPLPNEAQTLLWHLVWANVPCGAPPAPAELPRVFPWLAPTRTSEKGGRATTPADVHPLQAFWGMPRRIRLDFTANAEGVPCDLTGQADSRVVRAWRQRPWGTNYAQWGGVHPLSPCYCAKPGAELLYLHPQPGGIGYQHWQGLLSRHPGPTRRVAPAIEVFRRERFRDIRAGRAPWRLLAGGFDMDNMKARGFTESELPVYEPGDQEAAEAADQLLSALVAASHIVAGLLARCVRRALFGDGATVAADAALLASLRERLWADTADAFFEAARRAAEDATGPALREAWRKTLEQAARRLFDEAAPMDASGEGHPARIAAAARQLGVALRGYGKEGEELFSALEIEQPEAARAKPRKQRKRA
jgi:CRISPR system Cascade subunit CasA